MTKTKHSWTVFINDDHKSSYIKYKSKKDAIIAANTKWNEFTNYEKSIFYIHVVKIKTESNDIIEIIPFSEIYQ